MSSPLCQGALTVEAVEVRRWLPEKNREEGDHPAVEKSSQHVVAGHSSRLDKEIFCADHVLVAFLALLQMNSSSSVRSWNLINCPKFLSQLSLHVVQLIGHGKLRAQSPGASAFVNDVVVSYEIWDWCIALHFNRFFLLICCNKITKLDFRI